MQASGTKVIVTNLAGLDELPRKLPSQPANGSRGAARRITRHERTRWTEARIAHNTLKTASDNFFHKIRNVRTAKVLGNATWRRPQWRPAASGARLVVRAALRGKRTGASRGGTAAKRGPL